MLKTFVYRNTIAIRGVPVDTISELWALSIVCCLIPAHFLLVFFPPVQRLFSFAGFSNSYSLCSSHLLHCLFCVLLSSDFIFLSEFFFSHIDMRPEQSDLVDQNVHYE
jgi:hypothetical protein